MPHIWLIATIARRAALAAVLLPISVQAEPSDSGAKRKAAYRETPAIDIIEATYGPIGFSGNCDVVNKVRVVCAGHISCEVPIDQRLCPTPAIPLPGIIMALSVSYKCTAKSAVRRQRAEAPLSLDLRCG